MTLSRAGLVIAFVSGVAMYVCLSSSTANPMDDMTRTKPIISILLTLCPILIATYQSVPIRPWRALQAAKQTQVRLHIWPEYANQCLGEDLRIVPLPREKSNSTHRSKCLQALQPDLNNITHKDIL